MKIKAILRKFGEKAAVKSIEPRSAPRPFYQPKPPAKISDLIKK